MPCRAPQEVYAKLLLSSRGYPLWTPEPSNELLADRLEGLKIGDVGVVLPEDGGFEVFFNICLPHDHPFHRRHGVPNGFTHIQQNNLDIRTITNAENPGRIISTSSVDTVSGVEPGVGAASRVPENLNYQFSMSSREGALLILPEGAERYHLRNEDLFVSYAANHGAEWYRFARERLGRIISNDALYLITGVHKTNSWSVAAYEDNSGTGEFTARFQTRRIEGGHAAAGYIWDARGALDWRVGPAVSHGVSNQAVFILGLKIALRSIFTFMPRIEVTADAPSTRLKHAKASGPILRPFSGAGSKGAALSRGASTSNNRARGNVAKHAAASSAREVEERHDMHERVKDDHISQSQPFHPSNIINQYLLSRQSDAHIAVTRDSDWIAMLDKGLVTVEDLAHEDRLKNAVSKHYRTAVHEGCVYLQSRSEPTGYNHEPQSTVVGDVEGGATDASCPPFMVEGVLAQARTAPMTNIKSQEDPEVTTRRGQTAALGSSVPPNGSSFSKKDARRILGIPRRSSGSNFNSLSFPQGDTGISSRSSPHSPAVQTSLSSRQTPSVPNKSDRNPRVNGVADVVHDRMQDTPKCRNIIVFGEAGTGKSSTINHILGAANAAVSNNAVPCTLASACYKCQLDGTCYNLWDTRGLGEASFIRRMLGKDSESTIELKNFLRERFHNGEIDLLVYCVRASRATKASQRYYDKFCTVIRRFAAPVVVVATESEKFANMEEWWTRNVSRFQDLKMEFNGHACITTLPEDPRSVESRRKLVELITQKYDWEPQGSPAGSFLGSPAVRPNTGTRGPEKKRPLKNLLKKAILNRTAQSFTTSVTTELPNSTNGRVPSSCSTLPPTTDCHAPQPLPPHGLPHEEPVSGVQPYVDSNRDGANVSCSSLAAETGNAKSSPLESRTPSEYLRETRPASAQLTPSRKPQRKFTLTTATAITLTSSTDSGSSAAHTPSAKSVNSKFSELTSRSSYTSYPSDSSEISQSPTEGNDEITGKVPLRVSAATPLGMKMLPLPRQPAKRATLIRLNTD